MNAEERRLKDIYCGPEKAPPPADRVAELIAGLKEVGDGPLILTEPENILDLIAALERLQRLELGHIAYRSQKLVPYEERWFYTEGMAERLGYEVTGVYRRIEKERP
jgi:hypothetical protein